MLQMHVVDVYILGAGGHSKQVIDILLEQESQYRVAGVFDDAKEIGSLYYRGVVVLGDTGAAQEYLDTDGEAMLFCGIGDNATRKRVVRQFDRARFANVVASNASVSATVVVGRGNYIGRFANVSADTCLGDFNILNDGCCVTHDVYMGHFNHVCPHAVLGGGVSVGDVNLIGTGATVNPRVRVGSYNKIGSGAAVVKDVLRNGVTVVGVPGAVVSRRRVV